MNPLKDGKSNPEAIRAVNAKWSQVGGKYPTNNKEDAQIYGALSELARTRSHQQAKQSLGVETSNSEKLLQLFDILAAVYLNYLD